MPTGVIKRYNRKRGYGFLTQLDGGPDLFVHWTRLVGWGGQRPQCGGTVTYEPATDQDGKQIAVNVRRVRREVGS
ncbi:cold shock domain-containing protein [Nocardia terpenica]|uniref:cold-shock protein n=1 Tax=Nocardia terpenica TaxID=455432 RepID=UPI002FE21663